jgi:NADPH2:quinone reductase
MKAIRFEQAGGPAVLEVQQVELPEPGPGEVQLRHTAVGVNFIDIYHRSGAYPLPVPSGIGLEAAGVVEAVGAGVSALTSGDRVAYGTGPLGAYAEAAIVPATRVVKIPDSIDDETAAAMMLKGMTVRYLLRATYEVKPGDTILLHAAAGGVGLIACQWANALNATVIGTVGSEEKAELAKAHGCQHTILYDDEDVAARVMELTDGQGVPVAYDGIGQATIDASLASLSPRGMLVNFGNASGPVKSFDLGRLTAGSLFVTRPSLMTYVASDQELQDTASDLIDMVSTGRVSIEINQRYGLSDARTAHEDLEARRTTGASILIPGD